MPVSTDWIPFLLPKQQCQSTEGTKHWLKQQHNNDNRFTALCRGLPGWAGTRRNTHTPTIPIIIQSLSLTENASCLMPAFSIKFPVRQVLSSSWDGRPFGHNRYGPKIGGLCPLGGAGFPSNTMSPGLTPTFVPSGILIHPAIWPQYISQKVGVLFPPFFWGGGRAGSI